MTESHRRQSVDAFRSFLQQTPQKEICAVANDLEQLHSTPFASAQSFLGLPTCRKDLNHPPTAVGGIPINRPGKSRHSWVFRSIAPCRSERGRRLPDAKLFRAHTWQGSLQKVAVRRRVGVH